MNLLILPHGDLITCFNCPFYKGKRILKRYKFQVHALYKISSCPTSNGFYPPNFFRPFIEFRAKLNKKSNAGMYISLWRHITLKKFDHFHVKF